MAIVLKNSFTSTHNDSIFFIITGAALTANERRSGRRATNQKAEPVGGGGKIYHGAIKRSLALWSYRTIKKGFSDLELECPVMGGASNRN